MIKAILLNDLNQLAIQILFNRSFKVAQSIVFTTILGLLLAVVFVLAAGSAAAAPMPDLSSPIQGQRFSSPLPKISGGALNASEVLVYIDDVLNGTAAVSGDLFKYTPFVPLSSGDHAIQLQSKDSASGELSAKTIPTSITIIPNPSPTLLAPSQGARLGQSRVWVGGVARNDSLIRILVDGQEYTRTNVRNHSSGVGSFGVALKDLPLGGHAVTAIARDSRGKESFQSEVLVITIMPSTPAPTIFRPVVNADAGIERPFITGLTKNGLLVSIVIDDKIVGMTPTASNESGVASFSWQPTQALGLGGHKIEAFASDNGKLSNNSTEIFWQVGEVSEIEPAVPDESEPTSQAPEPEEPPISVAEPEESTPLTVKDNLDEEEPEEPIVPDVIDSVEVVDEPEGRVVADDDGVLGETDGPDADDDKLAQTNDTDEPDDDITEITPGAVVRDTSDDEERGEFTFNTSLIIGIVILVFLLLSILVWYIQEKRAQLGERVVNIFREDEEGGMPGDSPMDNGPTSEKPQDPIDIGMDLPGDFPKDTSSNVTHLPRDMHTDSVRPPSDEFGPLDEKDDDKFKSPPEPPTSEPPRYDPPFDEPTPPPDRRERRDSDKPEDLPPPPPPMF
ncbi:MAG: hypothetical protein QF747_00865 [Patescibacteria group bacterium]|jgi:hypothetical protein|nr:hypothetical protein [Patescibacteria group bacterium]MDP6756488.1 hypothetical protein [Patescibacteria group bacterium]